MIRIARIEDINTIMDIYHFAQQQMIQNGNPDQWGNTYPSIEIIKNDIQEERLYVIEEKEMIAVFVFIIGQDPTYQVIEGKWLNEEEYGVIHRVASAGKQKNILGRVLQYCETRIHNIRMDTHEKNTIMQHILEKNGFQFCGIIYVEDGSPRLAYQRIRK